MEVVIAFVVVCLIIWWGAKGEQRMLNPPKKKEWTAKDWERHIKKTDPQRYERMKRNGDNFDFSEDA